MTYNSEDRRVIPGAADGRAANRGEGGRDLGIQCLVILLLSSPLNFIAYRAAQAAINQASPIHPISGAVRNGAGVVEACFWIVGAVAVVSILGAFAAPQATARQTARRPVRVVLWLSMLSPLVLVPVALMLSNS